MSKRIPALAAVFVLIAAFAAGPAAAQGVNSLKSVSFQTTETGLNIAIMVDGEFLYQVQTLANPARLVIDCSPLARIDAPPYQEVGQAGVTSIRTGQFAAMIARVVLDFAGDIPGYQVTKTEGGLLVRIAPEFKPAAPQPVEAPPVRPQQPVREKPAPRVRPTEAAETAAAEAGEREGFANTMIGVHYGSYLVPDTQFQEIYGKDAPMTLGLSLSRTLVQYQGLSLDVEGSIRFYSKTGASIGDADPATFKMTPISLAGRLNYQWKYFQAFAGFGLDWYSYSETSTIANVTGNANGSHFTAGLYLIPPVLDGMLRVKVYYKFTKVSALANDVAVEIGGNEYGVGLSLGFNLFKKGLLSF
jgi:hypothetical protein